jgi:hypothetical protein
MIGMPRLISGWCTMAALAIRARRPALPPWRLRFVVIFVSFLVKWLAISAEQAFASRIGVAQWRTQCAAIDTAQSVGCLDPGSVLPAADEKQRGNHA